MKELRTVSAEVAELMVLMKHPNQAYQMSTSSFKVLTKEKKIKCYSSIGKKIWHNINILIKINLNAMNINIHIFIYFLFILKWQDNGENSKGRCNYT